MYLTQSLHRSLQQNPDRPATIFGDRVRTVAESVDRIARLAGALSALGVQRGDRVGILALNSDRYHEYFFAVPWIGAAVNPVNIRWSPAEIVYSLRESDTRVLLVDDTYASVVSALRAEFPELGTVIFCGDGEQPPDTPAYEALIDQAQPVEDTRTGGTELLGVFYTGGTTGHPKGVCCLTTTYSPRRSEVCPRASTSRPAAGYYTRRRCSISPASPRGPRDAWSARPR